MLEFLSICRMFRKQHSLVVMTLTCLVFGFMPGSVIMAQAGVSNSANMVHPDANRAHPGDAALLISFKVPTGGADVQLIVFDANGHRVCSLVDEFRRGGTYREPWDGCDESGSQATAGTYFTLLEAGENLVCSKMQLVR